MIGVTDANQTADWTALGVGHSEGVTTVGRDSRSSPVKTYL